MYVGFPGTGNIDIAVSLRSRYHKLMAKLTDSDVKHVAKLANLTLNEAEIEKFQEQLSDIINYITELSEIDVEGITPTSQTTGLENVTRVDETVSGLTQEAALSQAKATHNGYFKVSAILAERKTK
jgi:aspartyl-tRNA(Asn)/glutamyl-tRNA(Gln) amidotransferase subunit C